MGTLTRKIGRSAGLFCATLLLLALVVATGVTFLLATQFGRNFLAERALGVVNDSIPGRIEVQSLRQLSPWGVELEGVRVFDPAGTEVASLEYARAEFDWGELMAGTIGLSSVHLANGKVDLRVFEPERGLVAAFVDPDAPPSPPSSQPPPDLRIGGIHVEDMRVRLPRNDIAGQVDVQLGRLRGAFQLSEGVPSATLDEFEAQAHRQDRSLATVTMSGRWQASPEPSKLTLELQAGDIQLELDAEGVPPPATGWHEQPARAEVIVRGVSADALQELAPGLELEGAFEGEVGLRLIAEGTPRDLNAMGEVTTAGGQIGLARIEADQNRIEVELVTDGLALHRVRSDLPERTVSLRAVAAAEGFPPGPMKLTAKVRELQLDGSRLADVDAEATLTSDGLEEVDVEARDGDSSAQVTGELAFSGQGEAELRFDLRDDLVERAAKLADVKASGRLHGSGLLTLEQGTISASGRVNAERLVVEKRSVRRARLDLQASSTGSDLRGEAKLEAEDVDLGDAYLDDLKVSASGTPGAADVELELRGGRGAPPENGSRPPEEVIAFKAQARVEREAHATVVIASGEGKVLGETVEFSASRTRILDSGGLRTEAVTFEIAGQQVVVSGEFGRAEDEGLKLVLGPVDLGKVGRALGIERRLTGTAQAQVWVRGRAETPHLSWSARLNEAGLEGRPTVEGRSEGTFDARAGRSEIQVSLDASEGQGLALSLTGSGNFQGGPGFAERLLDADLDLNLSLERLTSEFLMAQTGPAQGTDGQVVTEFPAQGEAAAHLRVQGTPRSPELALTGSVDLLEGNVRTLHLQHRVEYSAGQLRVEVHADDEQGTWLRASARLESAEDGTQVEGAEIPGALANAVQAGSWNLSVSAEPRRLSRLPLASEWLPEGETPPVSLGLRLSAETPSPGVEPHLDLLVRALQLADSEQLDCPTGRGLMLETQLRHRGEENRVLVSVRDGERRLVTAELQARQALRPLLAGRRLEPGPLAATVTAKDLELASLPYLCGKASGVVNLSAQGQDLLGTAPQIDIDGTVDRFGLGSPDEVDVRLLVRADANEARLDLRIEGRGEYEQSAARVVAAVPWQFTQGHVELAEEVPLDLEVFLSHLPIAPFLPPDGPISYASGMLDGRVKASGTSRTPRLEGEIRLEDISFTSTDLAQPLRNVAGRIVFSGRRVEVPFFEAHDRDGVVSVTGFVDLTDMERVRAETRIIAKDFPLRQAGQVVAVTNVDATTEATVTPTMTRARLELSDVDTWIENTNIRRGIELERHPEFVIDGDIPEELASRSGAGRRSNGTSALRNQDEGSMQRSSSGRLSTEKEARTTRLVIDGTERFWVKREDFAVKLTTLLEADIQGDEVRVDGDVTIDRGYLQLFGKVFDLERESRLSFIGSNPPNPVLAIEARHNARSGSLVGVRIAGRAESPELTFLVDGQPVDASIAVRELFAGSASSDGQDAAAQAQSFVGGLTAGVLATTARRELGAAAPIIMIDPGAQAGEGRVRAGFELDDIIPQFLQPIVTGVYLEGIVARESNEGRAASTDVGALLEVYFPKRFFAAGQYGPGNSWSLDVGWQL